MSEHMSRHCLLEPQRALQGVDEHLLQVCWTTGHTALASDGQVIIGLGLNH
jgi:hypothetical protein